MSSTPVTSFFSVRRVKRDAVTLAPSTDYMVRSPSAQRTIRWDADAQDATRFATSELAAQSRDDDIALNAGAVWIVSLDILEVEVNLSSSSVEDESEISQSDAVDQLAEDSATLVNQVVVMTRALGSVNLLFERLQTVGLSNPNSLLTAEELAALIKT
jgi:hypothetical protein